MSWTREPVVLVAYTEPPSECPVVEIFGSEVTFGPTGTWQGYDRGEWWESVVLADTQGAPAALDDIDTTLAKYGYSRVGQWHGPQITRKGERYIAHAEIDFRSIG